jgi:Carbohydrate esterase, sialic acid-specific acetylesterase
MWLRALYNYFPMLAMTLVSMVNVYAQAASLFLIAGQSNAVGQGDSLRSVRCQLNTAFEYKSVTDSLVLLADPVGEDAHHFQAAKTGSIAPAFARSYSEYTGNKVIIISSARGGSSCHEEAELKDLGTWAKQGELLLFPEAAEKIKKATNKVHAPLSGIIWLQGERDANAINSKHITEREYEDSLADLIKRFRQNFGALLPFYIVETGFYHNHPREGFDAVRKAQRQIANETPFVYLVYDETDDFKKSNWMKDDIHYNQGALNHIGEVVANAIVKLERTYAK